MTIEPHADDESDALESEAVAVYRRLRAVMGNPHERSRTARRRTQSAADSGTVPFGAGRDPAGLSDVLNAITEELGWNSPLARGELLADWPTIVGSDVSTHAEPVGIDDGTLTVQCDSTAWATQLRLMRSEIVTTITQKYPDAGITSIRFLGPGVPTWKRGRLSVPGRGPRDTYG